MYYNVSGLIKEKIGSNREWSIEPINLNYDDLGLVKIQSGNFNLIKIDKGIWVKGSFGIIVNMNCIRCLNKLDISMDINIDEEYIYDNYIDKQFDDNFTIDDFNHLSLRECLREYIFVTSPRKPVCKKICKL